MRRDMTGQSKRLQLVNVREVYHGEINDVVICRDADAIADAFYTVLVVKNHVTAKKVLEIYEAAGGDASESYVECFARGQRFYIAFDYRKERPLEQFYMNSQYSIRECEGICMNLIAECIASRLPWPFLYLALSQGRIHLTVDRSIYFDCQFRLEELDESVREADCANLCAQIVTSLLENRVPGKLMSFQLLQKKAAHGEYYSFQELYRDLRLASLPVEKKGLRQRIWLFYRKHQDFIFRLMLAVCMALGITALLMLISQMVFGDIPFMRLFINTFKQIGTESLLQ